MSAEQQLFQNKKRVHEIAQAEACSYVYAREIFHADKIHIINEISSVW